MTIAKQIAKDVVKARGNKIDLQIGDAVTHSMTGIRGIIEEVCTIGDQTLLSVRTTRGQFLNKLSRQEFQLASVREVTRALGTDIKNPTCQESMPRIEGSISDHSILGELS